jgi:hypothetical protein
MTAIPPVFGSRNKRRLSFALGFIFRKKVFYRACDKLS